MSEHICRSPFCAELAAANGWCELHAPNERDVERERRQRRMARIRSNAGGTHQDKRHESRAEVKIGLKRERHGYGR